MNRTPTARPAGHDQDPHLTEGVCRALLNALLAPVERERALAHLAGCAACERLFKERVIERENLRASTVVRSGPDGTATFERLHESHETEADRSHENRSECERPATVARSTVAFGSRLCATLRQRRFAWGLSLAAITVVILLVLRPQGSGGPAPALRWLPLSAEEPALRTAAGIVTHRDLAAGLDAYAARDLDQAILLLGRATASDQFELVRRIFLASALAWRARYPETVSLLRTVEGRTLPDPWGSESRWTLYVALEATGQATSADSLLRILAQERGDVGDRARRRLRRSEQR